MPIDLDLRLEQAASFNGPEATNFSQGIESLRHCHVALDLTAHTAGDCLSNRTDSDIPNNPSPPFQTPSRLPPGPLHVSDFSNIWVFTPALVPAHHLSRFPHSSAYLLS